MMWPRKYFTNVFPFNRALPERLFVFMQSVSVYNPTRGYYLSQCSSSTPTSDTQQQQQQNHESNSRNESNNHARMLIEEPPRVANLKCDNVTKPQPACSFPMPKEYSWSRYFSLLCFYTHIYSCCEAAIHILISRDFFNLDKSWNCYLLGRMVLHRSAADVISYFQLVVCLLVFIWRKIHSSGELLYRLDGIVFMTSGERELEDRVSAEFDVHFEAEASEQKRPWLWSVLYMEIPQSDGRNLLFLRPNRTMKALRELKEFFENIFFIIMMVIISLILFMTPQIQVSYMLDANYIVNYPTCTPELESLAQNNQLSWWSMTFSGHRWLSMPVDFVLNTSIWVDSLFSLLIPPCLAILLSQDLVLHWRGLAVKLDSLLAKLRLRPRTSHHRTPISQRRYSTRRRRPPAPTSTGLHNYTPLPTLACDRNARDWRVQIGGEQQRQQQQQHSRGQQDNKSNAIEIHILQQEIIDFFKQLKYYNRYISLVATFIFLSWFSLFLISSYMAIKSGNMTLITIIRILQLYGFIAIIVPLYALLRLRNHTRQAYPIMASIMAIERDPIRKEYWSQILEYYTDKPIFGFTLINSYPITWMSYLNLIASSVSFLVILDTYYMFKSN